MATQLCMWVRVCVHVHVHVCMWCDSLACRLIASKAFKIHIPLLFLCQFSHHLPSPPFSHLPPFAPDYLYPPRRGLATGWFADICSSSQHTEVGAAYCVTSTTVTAPDLNTFTFIATLKQFHVFTCSGWYAEVTQVQYVQPTSHLQLFMRVHWLCSVAV